MSPMYFVKRIKREDLALVYLMDNFFSESKENTYLFFLIHFLNKV